MQAQAHHPGGLNEGPTHADFIKPGVIFGFRSVGDYGDYSDGQGNVYYFGRSKQPCMLDLSLVGENVTQNQKDMLKRKVRCVGLNAPSRILLWVRVDDIDKYWDEFRQQLRGWDRRARDGIEGTGPIITNVLVVGDNWYTVENMGPQAFGSWCRAIMQKVLHPLRVMRIAVEF
jgi:hypothetical protein